jgi:hypothetical protein
MKKQNLVFTPLHVWHVSHLDAMSLFLTTCEVAMPVRGCIGATADAILTELAADTAACFAQVHRQRKSPLTKEAKVLRKQCTDLFSEIKRTISFCAKSSRESLCAAGKELLFFFEPNWNINKKPFLTQVQDMILMLDKYNANPDLLALGKKIGIDALMIQLEADNARLSSIYFKRNEEVGSRPASGTHLRPAANESYMQFCTAIEQAARYTPNDELLWLFHNMDQLRKDQHEHLARKEKKKKSK